MGRFMESIGVIMLMGALAFVGFALVAVLFLQYLSGQGYSSAGAFGQAMSSYKALPVYVPARLRQRLPQAKTGVIILLMLGNRLVVGQRTLNTSHRNNC